MLKMDLVVMSGLGVLLSQAVGLQRQLRTCKKTKLLEFIMKLLRSALDVFDSVK